jgi:hypothetical protein
VSRQPIASPLIWWPLRWSGTSTSTSNMYHHLWRPKGQATSPENANPLRVVDTHSPVVRCIWARHSTESTMEGWAADLRSLRALDRRRCDGPCRGRTTAFNLVDRSFGLHHEPMMLRSTGRASRTALPFGRRSDPPTNGILQRGRASLGYRRCHPRLMISNDGRWARCKVIGGVSTSLRLVVGPNDDAEFRADRHVVCVIDAMGPDPECSSAESCKREVLASRRN